MAADVVCLNVPQHGKNFHNSIVTKTGGCTAACDILGIKKQSVKSDVKG